MYKGLRSLFKGSQGHRVTPKSQLYPLQSYAAILVDRKRCAMAKQFKRHAELSNDRYAEVGEPLIKSFVEYVQLLPETQSSYYGKSGGKLDYAFERTSRALELTQAYFAKESESSIPGKLVWLYAILSASLLQGIGKLTTDLSVTIYNQAGHRHKRWNPFEGLMQAQGGYYEYVFQQAEHLNLQNSATIFLAQKLMPKAGLTWLSQDSEVMAVWLALLAEDELAAGKFGPILARANAIALGKGFRTDFANRNLFDSRSLQPLVGTNEQVVVLGRRFVQWFKQALKNNQLVINQAPLLHLPGGGLLLLEGVFSLFLQGHPQLSALSWEQVQQAFLTQQLHRASALGNVVRTFYNPDNGERYQGIVYEKAKLQLPHTFKMINNQNAGAQTVSSEVFFNQPGYAFAPVIEQLASSGLSKNQQASAVFPTL